MERPPRAPERRLPRAVRELRHDAIFVEFAVALALVISIVALVYAMTVDTSFADFADVVRDFTGRVSAG
jgi:hypothetical protein